MKSRTATSRSSAGRKAAAKAAPPRKAAGLSRDELAGLYRTISLVRRVEERLSKLFSDGEVPGFIHLSIGQEAIAAGVCSALRPEDTLASNHRGHGHALAKGVPLDGFFAEIMGRDTGICRGRGGSMHIADMSAGMLGANGIVGAGIPLALGSALAHQTRGADAVAVVFFGDGALAEGVLHESLNMAALWKLPILFVCENNGWSEFSPTHRQFVTGITDLAAAFGIEAERVDGNDVEAVALAARRHRADLVAGRGPRVLECMTRRIRGHYEGDPQKYREDGEADPKVDPLARCRARLREAGVSEAALDSFDAEAEARIEAAVEAAHAAPQADLAAARADVYTEISR